MMMMMIPEETGACVELEWYGMRMVTCNSSSLKIYTDYAGWRSHTWTHWLQISNFTA